MRDYVRRLLERALAGRGGRRRRGGAGGGRARAAGPGPDRRDDAGAGRLRPAAAPARRTSALAPSRSSCCRRAPARRRASTGWTRARTTTWSSRSRRASWWRAIETQLKARAAEARRRGGARRRRGGDPRQGRVPRDARPRAAQSAGADPDALQLMQLRGERHLRAGARAHRAAGRATWCAWSTICSTSRASRAARSRSTRRSSTWARSIARAIELASPLLEQRMHHLTVDVAAGPDRRRRPDAARAGVREPADQRRQVHAARRRASRVSGDARRATTSRVAVSDTGIGIAPRDAAARVRSVRAGAAGRSTARRAASASGSASCKRWSTLHGGTVEAHSDGAGQGERVRRVLPRVGRRRATRRSRRRVSQVGQPRARRAGACWSSTTTKTPPTALAEALVDLGHAVEVAHDGPQALASSETFSPDVALLDIGLPVMDGYELARRIRARAAAVGDPAGRDHRLRPGQRPGRAPGGRLRRPPGQAGRPAS